MAKGRKRKGKTANATEMAKLLGVHMTTVVAWVDLGCPVVSRERVGRKTHWVFDVAAVKEWRNRELARREKPRADIKDPLSLPNIFISKEQERRFRRIMEGLMRPADK